MHQLVEHSPFVSDDGTVYIADKVSQFHVVDRGTGEVLATFDAAEYATSEEATGGRRAGGRRQQRLLVGSHQLRVKAINPGAQFHPQPSTLNSQPSTLYRLDPQPSALNPQPSALNPSSSTALCALQNFLAQTGMEDLAISPVSPKILTLNASQTPSTLAGELS